MQIQNYFYGVRNRRNITGRLTTILLEITNEVTRRRQSAKISRENFYTYTIKRYGVSTHSQTKRSAYKRPKPVKVETNKKLFEVDYFKWADYILESLLAFIAL